MRYFNARVTLLTLFTAALIGCRGAGDSPLPNLPAGTQCNGTVAVGSNTISGSGTCTVPCPVATPVGTTNGVPLVTASCAPATPQATATPLATATPAATPTPTPVPTPTPLPTPTPTPAPTPTPTPVPTPTPTPTPAPLTGSWIWEGTGAQSLNQSIGVLPNIGLGGATNGTVTIMTSASNGVLVSNSTCPSTFEVATGGNGIVTFTVNNPIMSCSFKLTDPSTGSSVTITYANTV